MMPRKIAARIDAALLTKNHTLRMLLLEVSDLQIAASRIALLIVRVRAAYTNPTLERVAKSGKSEHDPAHVLDIDRVGVLTHSELPGGADVDANRSERCRRRSGICSLLVART